MSDANATQALSETPAAPPGSTRLLVQMVVVFLLIFGFYYVSATTETYKEFIFRPYLLANASLSADILNLLGEGVTADGAEVGSARFSVTIARGCDGLPPMALFIAALGAFPAAWRLKLPGLLICLPILAAFNLVRIVSLYYVGAYYPDLFHVMHVDVWQVLYISFGVVLFCLWLWWAMGNPERAPT